MIEINIPGRGYYRLKHLLLDLNGTIALDGELLGGVEERLARLRALIDIWLVSADTFGSATALGNKLGVKVSVLPEGGESARKLEIVKKLGRDSTVCVGNGSNDAAMLESAAVGICVIGGEGASGIALRASAVVVNSIDAALDLLLNTTRLVATLRR